ncbi:uncharacterized protein METZ01_LOCUS454124, partial [marine metagenome]
VIKNSNKTAIELLAAFAGSSAIFGLLINSGNTYIESFAYFFLILSLPFYLLLRRLPFFKKRRSSPYKTIVPLSFVGGVLSFILTPLIVVAVFFAFAWATSGYESFITFVVTKLPENIEKQRECIVDNEWGLEEREGLYYVASKRACRQVQGDLFTGIYLQDNPWSNWNRSKGRGMLLGQDLIKEKKVFEAGVLVRAERTTERTSF